MLPFVGAPFFLSKDCPCPFVGAPVTLIDVPPPCFAFISIVGGGACAARCQKILHTQSTRYVFPSYVAVINMSDFRVSPDGLTPLLVDDSQSVTDTSVNHEDIPDIVKKSGFVLNDLYKLCLAFYKGKLISLDIKFGLDFLVQSHLY